MAITAQNLLGLTGLKGPVFQENPNNGDVLLDDLGQPEPYYINRGDVTNGFYYVTYNIDRIKKIAKVTMIPYKNERTFIRSLGAEKLTNLSPIVFHIRDEPATVQEDGSITEPAVTVFDSYLSYSEIRKRDNSEHDQILKFIKTEFTNSTRVNGAHRLQTFHIDFSAMVIRSITQDDINNALA
jgi:hypothetical protein